MLRELETHIHKTADSTHSAHANLKFGQLVVKDHANKKTKLPTAKAKEVYFATKERFVYGDVKLYRSDADPVFENIAKDEKVVLVKPMSGELYATDQIEMASVNVGTKLKVKDTGKFEADTTGADAIAIYVGKYADVTGLELHMVEII